MSDLVIGTAGHVDHGKTSLVRALTGVDLDRLPEEKARGITISLGFTPLLLGSGRTAGLVDVPGHEALVRTMVAGASGLDAVMLCVSAVEGVMPQTREHLAVLSLLGVRHGVVVQTMADQVDGELLALAADEISEVVRGTFLEGAEIVATSAVTGLGLSRLLECLDAVPSSTRSAAGKFRLPVDRSFIRRGFGTVVTGTAWGGTVADGEEVELLPGGQRARLRGIQVHGVTTAIARAGSRVALNLSGVEVGDVGRGLWVVAPGTMPASRVIDVRYRHLAESEPMESGAEVVALLATREVPGRLLALEGEGFEPNANGYAQLHLAEELPCLPGDRFVIRRPSPAATLGGGVVLDPWTKVIRKRSAGEALAELLLIECGDSLGWLQRAGSLGLSAAELAQRGTVGGGDRIGERFYHPEVVAQFRRDIADALLAAEQENPLSLGVARKAARIHSCRALDERTFLAFLEGEASAGRVVFDGPRVCRPGWKVVLSPPQAAWCAQTVKGAEAGGFSGLEAISPHPQADALLFLLRDRGEVVVIEGRVYAQSVLTSLKAKVAGYFSSEPELGPAQFKELTGQSRRTAIPLLEWLDAEGATKRVGDIRVRKMPV